jgi:hypothetical protein
LVAATYGALAARDLIHARRSLNTAKAALRRPDVTRARGALDSADHSLRSAEARINAFPLAPFRIVPPARGSTKAATNLIDATRDAVVGVKASLVIAEQVQHANGIGGVTTLPWASFSAPVAATRLHLARALHVGERNPGWLPGPVASQRNKALDQLASLVDAADRARVGVDLFGKLFDGTDRHLMVVIQNSADLRGAGGFPDQFVFVQVKGGEVKVAGSYSDDPLPAGITPGTDWARSADSPDFSDAGARWAAAVPGLLGGSPPDLIMGVDTAALAGLMKVTGPIKVGDVRVSSKNYERFSSDKVYRLYPGSAERQVFEDAFVSQFVRKLFAAGHRMPKYAEALGPLLDAKHVQVFSPHIPLQADLEQLHVAGTITDSADVTVGVFATQFPKEVSKTYPWLRRDVDYKLEMKGRRVTMHARITFTNKAPAGLPERVLGPINGHLKFHMSLFGLDANRPTVVDLDIAPGNSFTKEFVKSFAVTPGRRLRIAVRNGSNFGRGRWTFRTVNNDEPVRGFRIDQRRAPHVTTISVASDADYLFELPHSKSSE